MAGPPKKIIRFIVGTPEWMMSFGDLLCCLLVFFILLVCFSSAQAGKPCDMMGSFVEAGDPDMVTVEGDLRGRNEVRKPLLPPNPSAEKLTSANIIKNIYDLKDKLKKQGFTNTIITNETQEGVALEMPLSSLTAENASSQEIYKAVVTLQKSLDIDIELTFHLRGIGLDGDDNPVLNNSFALISQVHKHLLDQKVHPGACKVFLKGSTKKGTDMLRILFLNGTGRKRISIDEYLRL